MRGNKHIIVSILAVSILSIALALILNSALSSVENYQVFDISTDNNPEYIYEIYNNWGKVVKRDTVLGHAPTITYLSKSLLSIEVGAGTGFWQTQYYDARKNLFSDVFDSPIAVRGDRVVYMTISNGIPRLIARNI